MNREERQRTIVGVITLALMISAGTAIYFARNENAASDKYVIITSFPKQSGLKIGDDVFLEGARVGNVQKLSEGYPPPSIAVRIKVTKRAFKTLGPDSVAWIEYATPEKKARVIIKPGKPDKKGRFIKIKPVLGIEHPYK